MSYQTVFRPAPWLFGALAAGELVSTAGAVVVYLQDGAVWLIAPLALLALAFTMGFANLAMSRIELQPTEIRLASLFGVRSLPRRDVTSTRAEGGRVALQLQDGRWIALPALGYDGPSVLRSTQAWLAEPGSSLGGRPS